MPDFGGPAFDDDATLMRSFDAGAFDEVLRRHGAAVRRVARAFAPNAVDDVVQQTFVSAWMSRIKFDEERGTLSSWLCSIAHHKALNAHRFDQRHSGLQPLDKAEELAAADDTPLDVVERQADAERVRDALTRLSPGQRTALELRYFEELSHAEIQERTDAPPSTVKGRLRLGLDALRDDLDVA